MSGSITLKYKQKIKKICFRQNIPSEDFQCLIASHFELRGTITGIRDKLGNVFNIGYFVQKPYEIKPEIYTLLVDEQPLFDSRSPNNLSQQGQRISSRSITPPMKYLPQQQNILPQHQQQQVQQPQQSQIQNPQNYMSMNSLSSHNQNQILQQNFMNDIHSQSYQQQPQQNNYQQQHPSFHSQSMQYSKTNNLIQQHQAQQQQYLQKDQILVNTAANYIEDLFEFQELFLQSNELEDDKKLVGLFVLEEQNGQKYLEKHETLVLEFNEKVDFFYTYDRLENTNFILNNITISLPCFVLYRGEKKLLEIGLSNSYEQVQRLVQKCVANQIKNKNITASLLNSPDQQNSIQQYNNNQQKNNQNNNIQNLVSNQIQQNQNDFTEDFEELVNPIQSEQSNQQIQQQHQILQQQQQQQQTQQLQQIQQKQSQQQQQQIFEGTESFQQLPEQQNQLSRANSQNLQKEVVGYLDRMKQLGLLDNPQYYYFKCKAYEMLEEFLKTLYDDMSNVDYKSFSEGLMNQINQLFKNSNVPVVMPPQQQQQIQQLQDQQQRQRPQTQGGSTQQQQQRKKKKKLQCNVDNYIQLTEDFIEQGIVEEQQGTILKTFILEENKELLRVFNSFLSGVYGETILKKKLSDLSDKLASYLERPTSPFPHKQQLLKTLHTQVWQTIDNSENQKFLLELAASGDEMLFSTFDVYESDKDLEDFIDTLQRIIKIYNYNRDNALNDLNSEQLQDQGQLKQQKINSFYQEQVSMEQLENKEFQQQQQEVRLIQQQSSQKQLQQVLEEEQINQVENDQGSTFLKRGSKSNKVQKVDQQQQTKQVRVNSQSQNKQSQVKYSQTVQFLEFVERHIDTIQQEEYGMILYLVGNKDEDILELIKNNSYNKRSDLFPFQLLAKQKLNEQMNLEFTKDTLNFILQTRVNIKSTIHAVYSRFQVDGELKDFISDLKEAVEIDQQQTLYSKISSAEAIQNPKIPPNTQANTNIQSKIDLQSKNISNGEEENGLPNGQQQTPSMRNLSELQQQTQQQYEQQQQEAQQQQEQLYLEKFGDKNQGSSLAEQRKKSLQDDNSQRRSSKIQLLQMNEIQVGNSSFNSNNVSPASSTKKKGGLQVITNSPYRRKSKRGSSSFNQERTHRMSSGQISNSPLNNNSNEKIDLSGQNQKRKGSLLRLNDAGQLQQQQQKESSFGQKKGLFQMRKVLQEEREKYVIKENDLNELFEIQIQEFYNENYHQPQLEQIKIIQEQANLSQQEVDKLHQLLAINHVILHSLLLSYKDHGDIEQIRDELDVCQELQSFELDIKKVQKFNHFNAVLRYLYEGKQLITRRNYNIYIYLYLSEDISTMGALESYLISQDEMELIRDLKLIGQISKEKFNLDYDEMESYTDTIFDQMKILFALRNRFNVDEQIYIEKMIKQFDISFNNMFNKFKISKDQEQFIKDAKYLAEDRQNSHLQALKDLIFHLKNPDITHYSIIFEIIDEYGPKIKSIYQVYEITGDKSELEENIVLLYKQAYYESMMKKIMQVARDIGGSEKQLQFLQMLIEDENSILTSAYELYLLQKNSNPAHTYEDESELKETIEVCLENIKEKPKDN